MNANKHTIATSWIDPDDAPEISGAFFERADEYQGNILINVGFCLL
jgi:hypothetical protein